MMFAYKYGTLLFVSSQCTIAPTQYVNFLVMFSFVYFPLAFLTFSTDQQYKYRKEYVNEAIMLVRKLTPFLNFCFRNVKCNLFAKPCKYIAKRKRMRPRWQTALLEFIPKIKATKKFHKKIFFNGKKISKSVYIFFPKTCETNKNYPK